MLETAGFKLTNKTTGNLTQPETLATQHSDAVIVLLKIEALATPEEFKEHEGVIFHHSPVLSACLR